MRVRIRYSILAAALLSIGACIVIPVPTPEWGDAPYTDEQLQVLEEGIGTLHRSDVLAEFGSHPSRYAADRVFVYSWIMKQGIWIVGVATAGDTLAGESHHRLCLRFDETGILIDVRHIDSALFGADSEMRAVLNEWVREVAIASPDSGYVPLIDPNVFERRDITTPSAPVGIMSVNGDGQNSPCHADLDRMISDGYRVFSVELLRDRFYPWLENPWTSNLDVVAGNPLLEKPRNEIGLRFIVVANSDIEFPRDEFCRPDSGIGISCYFVDAGTLRFVAVLDLGQTIPEQDPNSLPGDRILRIPVFLDDKDDACQILMTYALSDIEKRVEKE